MSDARSEHAEAATPRWQAVDPGLLDYASWDDGQVLFHHPSGKTHFVNAQTVQLLEILSVPRDLDEVAVLLWGELPAAEREEQQAEVFDLLLRLTELGLVHIQ